MAVPGIKMDKTRSTGFFEWNFEKLDHVISPYKFSSKFHFYESSNHFLSLKCYSSDDFGNFCAFRLCGCQNPQKICSPCFYIMCLINSEGKECFTTRGIMEKCSKTALMVVSESSLRENFRNGSLTVHFLWFKDKPQTLKLHNKGTQTDPVNFADDFQSNLQTRPFQVFSIRKKDNTANSADGRQRNQWSGESRPFSIFDKKKAEEFSSLDQYLPCIFNPRFLETSANGHPTFCENKTMNNFVLEYGQIQFPVHGIIISPFSAVLFVAYFLEAMDSNNGKMRMPEADETTSSGTPDSMHVGKLRGLTSDTALSMYEVANKYSLNQMRDNCMQFLMNNLTVGNICEAAVMAEKQCEQGLQKEVVQFIGERLEEVQKTDKWKEFLNTNSILASKLLSLALIGNKKMYK